MSAAWDGNNNVQQEPLPRQKRMIRMWAYTCVGIAFYFFIRFKVGF